MTRCIICGADISTPDWYAQISRKYCDHCRKERRRETKAEWARKFRQAKREENRKIRVLCNEQQKVIEALQAEILRMREMCKKGEKQE